MGAVYQSSEQLSAVLGNLARRMFALPENREGFVENGLTVKFVITDPECSVYLDPKDSQIVRDGDDQSADITMSMAADFMHDFWLGKTNIIKSMENGDLTITLEPHVPAVKAVDLLPLLLPGLEIYPELELSES